MLFSGHSSRPDLPSLDGVGQSVAILARDELGDLDELCGLAANLVWRIASRMAPKKCARPVPPVRAPDYCRRWGTCRAHASDAASKRKVTTYSQPGPTLHSAHGCGSP